MVLNLRESRWEYMASAIYSLEMLIPQISL
jgi:pyrroloquinoline quinone (PQQ) biosynthesis protein C